MEGQPHSVRVNGADLAYVEQGAGDPVVFVHGSLNDYRRWGEQLAPFAARHRAVAYSRRYHWPNARPDPGVAYEGAAHAADLAALVEALGAGPAHLVGHSYGAVVALAVAAARPELVRTLTLGEPPLLGWLLGSPDGAALAGGLMAGAWEPARQAFGRGEPEAGARLFIDGVIGPGAFDQLPPPVRAQALDNAAEMRLEMETLPEAYFPPFAPEDAGLVQVPALLLTGEYSPPMFLRIVDELARALPAAERATVAGASHDLGNAPAFNGTVLGFLAEH